MKSSWISRGAAAATVAAITLLSTTPASAASNWSSSAPKYATSVGTVTEKKVTISGETFTIQLRVGKYSSRSYFWARAPKDSDTKGMVLILQVYNASTKKWESNTELLQGNTAYTNGYRSIHKYGYKACAKHSNLGGAAPVCTGARYV